MQYHIFDAFDLLSVISFLSALNSPCNTNGSHEGAKMWLFHFFMKSSSAFALNARVCLKTVSSSYPSSATGELLETCLDTVKYPFQTYATDDVIAETITALTH